LVTYCNEYEIPIGFTVGSVGGYKRHLFFKALPEIVLGVARNPLPVWKNTVRRLLLRVGGRFGIERSSSSVVRADVADNNIMAVSRSAGRGGMELMLAFEDAARRRGVKPHFHDQTLRPYAPTYLVRPDWDRQPSHDGPGRSTPQLPPTAVVP
jgi:hypothetical protein